MNLEYVVQELFEISTYLLHMKYKTYHISIE